MEKYCLVKGKSGLIFYIDARQRDLLIRTREAEVLADNLTIQEAQALFKISKHNQGESNEFR